MMFQARARCLLAAIFASSACGGDPTVAGDSGLADAPTGADAAAADAANDPLAAFSADTAATFYLIADGRTVDGHDRVLYMPKVMYPALGPSLTIAQVGQSRVVNGIFAAFDGNRADVARLFTEANDHAITLVRADLAIPHRVCGTSDLLDQLSWHDSCGLSPRQISFATVSMVAASNATNSAAFDARVATHLGDGSSWHDVVEGGVTWHLADGRVLESTLDISCIGSIRANGGAELFDSPACRARYALAQ
jgi:hypothetical protein